MVPRKSRLGQMGKNVSTAPATIDEAVTIAAILHRGSLAGVACPVAVRFIGVVPSGRAEQFELANAVAPAKLGDVGSH